MDSAKFLLFVLSIGPLTAVLDFRETYFCLCISLPFYLPSYLCVLLVTFNFKELRATCCTKEETFLVSFASKVNCALPKEIIFLLFSYSCCPYAFSFSSTGLQSPMSDQSRASVTCSCVYCQHRPMLGQLGEQDKARQKTIWAHYPLTKLYDHMI